MRIAVTGGSGRIGQFVIRELASRGHEVMNLDRRMAKGLPARFVYVDLRAREQVQPVLEQCQAVIHLGEIPNQSAGLSPEEVYANNTRVGSMVLQTAADLGMARCLYISTCQVYGCWDRPSVPPLLVPLDETHPLQPQNVYALSKAANEGYARCVSAASGLSVAIFRMPWVVTIRVDEGHWGWFESREHAAEGMATYLHATDAARAMALAVENPRPGCEAYHLAAADTSCLAPLQKLWAALAGWPPLPNDWPAHRSVMVTDKAREHFGWTPLWSMHEQYAKWKAAHATA